MKNIINYVKNYGSKSFDEVGLNDIDFLVFSSLSYVPFNNIFLDSAKYSLGQLHKMFFSNTSDKENKNNIIALRKSIELFNLVGSSKRYSDIKLYNYEYIYSDDTQFCALMLELSKNLIFVSFEGTDQLISGWEEDFKLSYKFPVPAQKYAISYLNRHCSFNFSKIILGGHSKGGNLALVASMYCHFWIRSRIIKVINFDGPGLLLKQLKSRKYKKIYDRYYHIIPSFSLIGLVLYHSDNYYVVDTYEKSIFAHDFMTWKIEDTNFKFTKLSYFSKTFSLAVLKWLEGYSDLEKEKFVTSLFDVCRRAGIDDLLDIKSDMLGGILSIVKETKNIDGKTSEMIKEFFSFVFDYFKDDLKMNFDKKIKSIINK